MPTEAPTRTPTQSLAGRRLLVVEDEALIALMVQDALEEAGGAVTLVHDGNSALAAFTAAAQQVLPFDAVVVNLGLPDMDGAKVIARLRAQQPSLPVLVASGSIRASGHGAPIRVRDSRLTAVVSKPFNPTLLAATFADLISEAERDRA